MWEYKTEIIFESNMNDSMRKWTENNWELIAVVHYSENSFGKSYRVFLKRPKP